LTIGVTAVAAILLLTTLWGWLRPAPEAPKPVIRYTLVLAEEEALQPVFGTSIALSPDGSRLVYVGSSDEAGFQLWLRERDQLEARPLPGTDWGQQPFFAPDGERVGFVTEDGQLKVVSLTGEPPLTLVDAGVRRHGGSWGADGYVYFKSRLHGDLMRVPTTGGGVPEPVPTLDTTLQLVYPRWPDVLPSGKGVLLTVGGGSTTANESDSVVVVDLATGEHRVLVRGIFGRYAASGHLVYVRYDGALLAAPFDQDKLVLTGPAVALLGEIAVRPGPDLALSETGRLVYAAGSAGASADHVVWVDRDGTAELLDPSWGGSFVALALSPDETRLAVSSGINNSEEQLWIKRLDRGPLSLLTFQGDLNRRPAWTRDGRAVTFVSDRGENRDLYVKRADGSAGAELLLDDARPVDEGFYSPDGEWLVYRLGQTDGDRDLFAIRPGVDSVGTPLVATSFNENAPALSPDGQWLAYVSNESGRDEVYVRPFPNAGEAKWQVSTTGGIEPVWAHSGRELFYKGATEPYDLITAEVVPGTTFVVGEQRTLFSTSAYRFDAVHQAYDVTADDQRFVMIREPQAEAYELIVVENFFEELKAKVGN
jgi:serine/threonine-protein kinase